MMFEKKPKKQPGKPSLWNCCEALSTFPQHIFTFSKYSCQTILFHILHVLSPSSSLYYFRCSYYFFPRSKFLTCLQPLKRAALGTSRPLPHQPTTSGAGTSHSPTAGAGGHGGPGQGRGKDRLGRGGKSPTLGWGVRSQERCLTYNSLRQFFIPSLGSVFSCITAFGESLC